MKLNVKVIFFIFILISFSSICLAEDFWMKMNWENKAWDIFYTAQDEIYINSLSDDGIWNVFVSKDYGNTWDSIPKPKSKLKDSYYSLKHIDNTGNNLIVADVFSDVFIANKDTLEWSYLGTTKSSKYEIMYYHNKRLYSIYGGGVMKSNEDWTEWNEVISTSTVEDFKVVVADSIGTLYAGSINHLLNDGGIYRSFDDGDTWEWYPEQFFVTTMGVDTKGRIFAGCYDKIIRSVDNGETWQNILNLTAYPKCVLINSIDEIYMGFSADWGFQGVAFSGDHGESWQMINSGIGGQPSQGGTGAIDGMAISPDGYIYLATDGGVYRSVNSTTGIEDSGNITGIELYQN